jgi:hypothetical protein
MDELTSEHLSVYPNPTRGVLRIELNLDQTEDIQLNLFNLNGQLVHTFDAGKTNQYSKEINLSAQQSGIYFLQIITPSATGAKRIILHP